MAKLDREEGESQDEAALRLREVIDTIGKRGGLGEHVRCVVSVSMLTEGWDANNVTHILGVRAFESQLLCEQVVGRGLRRMSYQAYKDEKTGKELFPAEYVDVYGIPFSLIPYKGKPKEKDPRPDPVYHAIYAVEERSDFEIRMPNVESYVYELRDQGIKCDIDELEPLHVNKTPGEVWLRPTRGYHDDSSPAADTGDFVKQTREEYYKSIRPQQIVFRLAQMIVDDLMSGAQAEGDRARAELRLRARHQLFPEVVGIVQTYIEKKVIYREGLKPQELGLQIYAKQVVHRVRDGILPAASEKGKLIPVVNRFRPYNTTSDVNYQTTRPVIDLTKSHLNRAMLQSGAESGGGERGAIEILEELDCVEYYTPNDRQVGLVVPYDYNGETKSYEPDFVVVLQGGVTVMLEIKGGAGKIHDPDMVPAKNAAAKKWCAAVSNLGRYGQWVFEIFDEDEEISDLRSLLMQHPENARDLPFEIVDGASTDVWVDCVPLTSLRTIATKTDPQQLLADGAWFIDLIRWDKQPHFEKGMFVVKIHGAAMEPTIPAGSYCLFQAETDGRQEDKVLFVGNSGISDPQTGGDWTVRRIETVQREESDEEWTHDRVVLKSDNDAFPAFILELPKEADLQVFGEFVSVIRSQRSADESLVGSDAAEL